jgi:tetratricopeptide (TPR) repeat protein
MVRRTNGRPTWLSMLALVAGLAVATPALAQSTGMVKGVVTDDKGQPVDGAKVSIEMNGGTGRRYESKTNKKGEYIQIGLTGGSYKITAEKDKLGSAPVTVNVRVNTTAQADLVLGVASAAASKEAAEKNAQLKKVFDEGVALSSAGKHDEAIAKFNEAIGVSATCYDCYNNIGYSYAQKKDWEKAEAAYKKSTEIKPDDATAHSGLATVYNAERKFDLAAEEGAKATQLAGNLSAGGGGGSADAQYNQGVILWNSGKIADAKKAFEGAVAANPNHAEAHYQLGMALVNEGNMAGAATEFETYLKLAPEGPNAATAKSLVAQLKK